MKIYKNKIFRILASVTFISSLGDSLYALAITLSVYNLTGSIAGVAFMWLIRALVRIPCQFFAGVLVDRFNRKKLCIYVYLLSAALISSFVFTNGKYVILAYVIIFILQGTSDVDNMAQMGLMSELIPEEDLVDANNIFSIIGNVVLLIGPGIGGLLYKFFGASIMYGIDAISFLIVAGLMLLVPYTEKEYNKKQEFTLFKFAKEGIKEVKKLPIIQYIIIASIFFGMLGRFYEIDKVYVADKILNIGAEGIIYLIYAFSIGGFIGPVVNKFIEKLSKNDIVKYSISCILFTCAFILWGFASNLWLNLFANLLIGIFETSQSVMTDVIFMKRVNKEVIGRVMAYRKIVVILSAILGIIAAPILVDLLGVSFSMMLIGVLAIFMTGWLGLRNREKVIS